jgi:hypothetical protein
VRDLIGRKYVLEEVEGIYIAKRKGMNLSIDE